MNKYFLPMRKVMKCLNLFTYLLFLVFPGAATAESTFQACKGAGEQSLSQNICLDCDRGQAQINTQGLAHLSQLAGPLKDDIDFRTELAGQVETLIDFQRRKYRITKECFQNTERHQNCSEIKAQVKKEVMHKYDSMRLLMAFNKNDIRENSNFTDQNEKYNTKLNHPFSDYAKISDLSKPEAIRAKEIYAQAIEDAANDIITERPELKNKINPKKLKEDYIKNLPSFKKYENGDIKILLSKKLNQFYVNKSKKYYQFLAETPIIGYVKSQTPKDQELADGFAKLEEKLQKYNSRVFKEKYRRGQKWVDKDWEEIFGFTHIVESVLAKNPKWCAQAEKLKSELDKKKRHDQVFNMAVGFASGIACVAGAEICIATGLTVGFSGIDRAQTKLENIYSSQVVAGQLNEYTNLKEAERDVWVERALLPLAFFGAGKSAVATLKASSKELPTQAIKADTSNFVKISDPFIDNVLEGPLSSKLGVKKIGVNEKNEPIYIVPTAPEINKIFNLSEKSNIYFLSDSRNVVPTEEFHRDLARGKIRISTVDMHDVVDHVAGYMLLAKSSQWDKAIKLLSETFKYTDNKSLTQGLKNKIYNIREDLAMDIEIISNNISRIEKRNDPKENPFIEQQIEFLKQKVAEHELRLAKALEESHVSIDGVLNYVQSQVTPGKTTSEIKQGSVTYALGIRATNSTQYTIPTAEKINKTIKLTNPQSNTVFKETGVVSFEQNRDHWAQGIISYSQGHPHDALEHLPGYIEFLKHPEAELSQKLVRESMEFAQGKNADKISKAKAEGIANDIMQALEEYTNQISKADQKGNKEAKRAAVDELKNYIQQVAIRFNDLKNSTSKFYLAKKQWESIASEKLPEDVPYFALGLSDRLQNFTMGMSQKLNHDVFDFGVTSTNLNKPKNPKATLRFAQTYMDVGYDETRLVRELIKVSQNRKAILFNLDGIDLNQYTKLDGKLYLPKENRTNNELKLILENKNIFNHVRWYKNGQELSFEELEKLFGKDHPDLFK